MPWVTPRTADGRFLLGAVDAAKTRTAIHRRLCGVCGRALGDRLVLLPATPVSLLYDEPVQRRDWTRTAIRITAHARCTDGRDVRVIYRSERNDTEHWAEFWSIAVNGFIPATGHDVVRPSPPWIAHTAAQTLRAELGR